MLGTQLSEQTHRTGSRIRGQGSWDHLQSKRDTSVGILRDAFVFLGFFHQMMSNGHLSSSTSGQETRIDQNIASHIQSVGKIAFNFVEEVLASATQENSTRSWVFAIRDIGKVLITDFPHFEKTTSGTDILFPNLFRTMNNGCTGCFCNTVCDRLPETTKSSDVRLHQEVLGQIGETFLCDDNVRFEGDNRVTHPTDKVLLKLQECLKVTGLLEQHLCLALTLLVFEAAVEQENTWVFDATTHLAVCHVLVHHHTWNHLTIGDASTGNLFDLHVALDVHADTLVCLLGDCAHCVECHVGHEIVPARDELGANTRLQNREHQLVVLHIHWLRNGGHVRQRILECLRETLDQNGRVYVALQPRASQTKHLASQNDDRSGAVAHLLVLRATQLDHALGCRM
mmetsp:Transcript_18397/g.46778  ORF Transcript_18397/g.46778 Transcript_18397/m.46778 type:complete len:398 (-) Transcript_18397:289-1482(-)